MGLPAHPCNQQVESAARRAAVASPAAQRGAYPARLLQERFGVARPAAHAHVHPRLGAFRRAPPAEVDRPAVAAQARGEAPVPRIGILRSLRLSRQLSCILTQSPCNSLISAPFVKKAMRPRRWSNGLRFPKSSNMRSWTGACWRCWPGACSTRESRRRS